MSKNDNEAGVFSGAASAPSKPGYVKLREDVAAIRKLFDDPAFKGRFDMLVWGEHVGSHDPDENNYCGTTACLAGWLAQVGSLRGEWDDDGRFDSVCGLSFIDQACAVYGLSYDAAYKLFYDASIYSGRAALEQKLDEASGLAAQLEARTEQMKRKKK